MCRAPVPRAPCLYIDLLSPARLFKPPARKFGENHAQETKIVQNPFMRSTSPRYTSRISCLFACFTIARESYHPVLRPRHEEHSLFIALLRAVSSVDAPCQRV